MTTVSREEMVPNFDYCCHGIERKDCEQCSRALAAKPADVREIDPRVYNLAQKIRGSDIEQMGIARFAVLTVLIPEHEIEDFADALCATKPKP